MLKDFTLSLELEPTENRVVQTAAIFWSHDVNTAKIYIELLRKGTPIILNKDVTVRVMMLFDDENKSEHIYTAKIEDELKGLVSITLEESMRMYVGQVTCGVYVDYQNEEKTDNGYFTFGMRRSLIDKDMPELQKLYVSDFEKALEKFEEIEKKIEENDVVTHPELKKYTYDKTTIDGKVKGLEDSKVDSSLYEQEMKSKVNIEELEKVEKQTRKKNEDITMSDLSQELREAWVGGETEVPITKVGSVGFESFKEYIQKDISIENNVPLELEKGGWNVDGTEDNSQYALSNYRRFHLSVNSYEVYHLKFELGSMKRILFFNEDKFLSYYETNETYHVINIPSGVNHMKIQTYQAGSILPTLQKLSYDNIISQTALDDKLKDFENGFNIKNRSVSSLKLEHKMQLDTGRYMKLPPVPEPGGWKTDGTEDNSQYALSNYIRFQYKPSSDNVFRPHLVKGGFTAAMQSVLTFDKDGKKLDGFNIENGKEKVFEFNENVATIKCYSYKVNNFEIGHYIYDSIASKKYVDEQLKKNVNAVPEHYIAYMNNKINEINSIVFNNNYDDMFVFITDTHDKDNANNSPALINEIITKTPVNKIFYGGDIVVAFGSDEDMRKTIEGHNQRYQSFVDKRLFFPILGNHDFSIKHSKESTSGKTLNKDITYNLMFKKTENYLNNNGKSYYVYEKGNIKYILLDTVQKPIKGEDVPWGLTYGVQQDQVDFLIKELKTNKDIIVIGHIPIVSGIPVYTEELEPVSKILEAFSSKKEINYEGKGVSVHADFSSNENNLIMYLSGHNHQDRHIKQNNFLNVSTTCDALYKDDSFDRVKGTISEQAFDVFLVDKKNRKVRTVRVGAGSNRDFIF